MFQKRTYRETFNNKRFKAFKIQHLETDLWIGIDPDSYREEMEGIVGFKIRELRQKLDNWIKLEPQFAKSLEPFMPSEAAPAEAKEMAQSAARAGIGPMASVAGLFSREAGEALLQNFSIKELVIENGGDIFALVNQKLLLTVFAGSSPLSEKIGIVIPSGCGKIGVCTSAGTVGPSLSFGNADAVAIVCKNVLLADALATAIGNEVKHQEDIERALKFSEMFTEILSLVIIKDEKAGVRGAFEIKIIKSMDKLVLGSFCKSFSSRKLKAFDKNKTEKQS